VCPLGHARLDTTALYTRVAVNTIRDVMSPLERLSLNLAKIPTRNPAKEEAPA
jgi:integrase/recombinase XerD